MQSAWSSNNTLHSQRDCVPSGSHPKFLTNIPIKAASNETPTDSATLWTYYNVYGKIKIIILKMLTGY